MKFYPEVYLPDPPQEEKPDGYVRRLSVRLTEIFRDIASAFDNPYFSGLTKINRIDDVPNEVYDLYTNSSAIKQLTRGTLATAVQPDKNNFIYSVRPVASLAGTSGHPATFRGYDFDVSFSASTAYDAGYGIIGALRPAGAGSFKALYGRVAPLAGFTGVAVGVVAGAEFISGQAYCWAIQTDVTGANTSDAAGSSTHLYLGSNLSGSKCAWGVYVANLNNFQNAVFRWSHYQATETAAFLEQADDGGTVVHQVDYLGRTTKAKGLTLTGNGTPFLVASSALTGQTAAKTTTTIYAVPAAGAGLYRVSFTATVTTAAVGTLGGSNGFLVTYTDPNDSVAKTTNVVAADTTTGNNTASAVSRVLTVYAKASTNIQYSFDYTSAAGMAYDLNVAVEYLG